jgi:hypothetical protein
LWTAIIGAAATATGTPTTADGMLISGLSLAQSHALVKISSAFASGLSNVKNISNLFSLFIYARH